MQILQWVIFVLNNYLMSRDKMDTRKIRTKCWFVCNATLKNDGFN